jgi:hypothetical protein
MNEDENKKVDDVMKAIQLAASGSLQKENNGVDLLSIVKKVSRNRRKGESLE